MKRAERALHKEISNGVYLPALQPHYKTKTLSRDHGRSGRCSAQYGCMLLMCEISKEIGTSSNKNRIGKKNRQDEGSAAGKQEASCSTAGVDSLSCIRFYVHLAQIIVPHPLY